MADGAIKNLSSYEQIMANHEKYADKFVDANKEIVNSETFLSLLVAEMTNQEREQLVDVMYAVLGSGGAESVYDLLHPKNIRTYIRTLTSDEHLRRVLSSEFSGLIEAARKTKAKFEENREDQLLLEDA
jgi:hypothetical protein